VVELRATCENCNKALPPEFVEARICTYECAFCATCVEPAAHARFAAAIKTIPPRRR
jgi:hypothetical protein